MGHPLLSLIAVAAIAISGPAASLPPDDQSGGSVRLGFWTPGLVLAPTVAVSSWRGQYGIGITASGYAYLPSDRSTVAIIPVPLLDALVRIRDNAWLGLPVVNQTLLGVRVMAPFGLMPAVGASWDLATGVLGTHLLVGLLGSTVLTTHALDSQAQLAGSLGPFGWSVGWRHLALTDPNGRTMTGPTLGFALPL